MIKEETIRELIIQKDFYNQLQSNMWNPQHPEVHKYTLDVICTLGSAKNREELDESFQTLIKFRKESDITGTEEFELEKYNKYLDLL